MISRSGNKYSIKKEKSTFPFTNLSKLDISSITSLSIVELQMDSL